MQVIAYFLAAISKVMVCFFHKLSDEIDEI